MIEGDDKTNFSPLTIPLDLKGLVSCFPKRLPTAEEYESCVCYELTSKSPVFDPHDPTYAQQEAACVDYCGSVKTTGDEVFRRDKQRRLCGVAMTDDDLFGSSLNHDPFLSSLLTSTVRVSNIQIGSPAPGIDATTLARNWVIGLEKAERTIKATTQRGIKTVLHPTLSPLSYQQSAASFRRLPIDCITDTMKSQEVSKRENKYVQVY